MKLTHRKLLVLCGLLIAAGTFFSFKRDTRNFEISKNLNIFNAVFRELDICYVDTVDPEKSIEAGALTVMVGHIMQPAWQKKINPSLKDEDIMPGNLSPELVGHPN